MTLKRFEAMTLHMVFLPSGRVVMVPEPGNIALRCGDGIFPAAALGESARPMLTVPAGVLQSSADARRGYSSGHRAALPPILTRSQRAMKCSASWGASAPAAGEVLA